MCHQIPKIQSPQQSKNWMTSGEQRTDAPTFPRSPVEKTPKAQTSSGPKSFWVMDDAPTCSRYPTTKPSKSYNSFSNPDVNNKYLDLNNLTDPFTLKKEKESHLSDLISHLHKLFEDRGVNASYEFVPVSFDPVNKSCEHHGTETGFGEQPPESNVEAPKMPSVVLQRETNAKTQETKSQTTPVVTQQHNDVEEVVKNVGKLGKQRRHKFLRRASKSKKTENKCGQKTKKKLYSIRRYKTDLDFQSRQKKYMAQRYNEHPEVREKKKAYATSRYACDQEYRQKQKSHVTSRYACDQEYRQKQKTHVTSRYACDQEYRQKQKTHVTSRYACDQEYRRKQKTHFTSRYACDQEFRQEWKTRVTSRYACDQEYRQKKQQGIQTRILFSTLNVFFNFSTEEFQGIDLTQSDLDGDAGSTPAASAHARKGRLGLKRREHPGNAGNSPATTSGASVLEQRSRGTETLEPVQPHGGDTTREARRSETGSTDPEARRREPDTRSLESEVQPAREGVNSHPLTANERERLQRFDVFCEIADFIKKPDDLERLQRLDALCEIADYNVAVANVGEPSSSTANNSFQPLEDALLLLNQNPSSSDVENYSHSLELALHQIDQTPPSSSPPSPSPSSSSPSPSSSPPSPSPSSSSPSPSPSPPSPFPSSSSPLPTPSSCSHANESQVPPPSPPPNPQVHAQHGGGGDEGRGLSDSPPRPSTSSSSSSNITTVPRERFNNLELRRVFTVPPARNIPDLAQFYDDVMLILREMADAVRAQVGRNDVIQLELFGENVQNHVSVVVEDEHGDAILPAFEGLLERLVQSNAEIASDARLELVVQVVHDPRGGVKRKLDKTLDCEIIRIKRQHLYIVDNRNDHLCFAINLAHVNDPPITDNQDCRGVSFECAEDKATCGGSQSNHFEATETGQMSSENDMTNFETLTPRLHMLISNPEKRLLGKALLSGSFAIQIQPPSSPLHIFRNLPAFLGSCCNLLMVTGPRTSWWFGINNLRGNPAVNYLNTFTGGTGPEKDAMSSPTRRLTQILRTIESSPGVQATHSGVTMRPLQTEQQSQVSSN
ncbi:hypothetical protein D9C73_023402 [Collichthys lucidus]|uniref:Uncharacterized protein n=1 Tax=Collichthys lucidus TaxID=240159 RepID=A0A4U5VIW1_COLLU|nr:hypothetical protein D9C73_023402 [Collichthys lucidus]